MRIFPNVNDAIIDRDIFEKVQKMMLTRKRTSTVREPDIMHGYLLCVDCGRRLYIRRNSNSNRKTVYFCSGYLKQGSACTNHMIAADDLYALVIESIDTFSKLIKESKRITELTPDIMLTLIDKILVFQKNYETKEQIIQIFFKGVGNLQ